MITQITTRRKGRSGITPVRDTRRTMLQLLRQLIELFPEEAGAMLKNIVDKEKRLADNLG